MVRIIAAIVALAAALLLGVFFGTYGLAQVQNGQAHAANLIIGGALVLSIVLVVVLSFLPGHGGVRHE